MKLLKGAFFILTLAFPWCTSLATAQPFTSKTCNQYAQNTATILITEETKAPFDSGEQLEKGDVIALVTKEGNCAGMATWQGANTALPVSEYWSDSLGTVPGYKADDELQYRLWNASQDSVYEADVSYASCEICRSENTFANDGVYVLSRIEIGASSRSSEEARLLALAPNYPNPVSQQTTIPFTLSEPSDVTLSVYNALGQKVAVLVSREMPAGSHEVQWNASRAASGLYVYKLAAGNKVKTRRMLVVN